MAPTRRKSPDAPPGGAKVTREDWLAVALDVLVSQGVEKVKILTLGQRLGVSRSSFYWYFRDREDLLDALLARWHETNTAALARHAARPAPTITAAVAQVFRCFVDVELFDPRLDFAVREWARRSGTVRRRLDRSDDERLAALSAMFARHGYAREEAEVRARVLYYMQIGYYALDLQEPLEARLARVPAYLAAFTGRAPSDDEVDALAAFAREAQASRP